MSNEVEIKPIQAKLLSSPLVAWICLFKSSNSEEDGEPRVTYQDLYQGNFLRSVMFQIYKRNVDDSIVTRGARVDEYVERLQNWSVIMKSIKTFYKDELQQVVTLKLPDILRISREPEDEASCEDIRTALLLILGCAIQCERKEFYIQQIIKSLNSELQHAIKDCITEITENTENIISLDTPVESLGVTGKALYYHLSRVLQERDSYIEEAAQATVDSEIYLAQLEELKGSALISPTSPEKHHLAVELAEFKAKNRRLRIELEEKADLTADMKAENLELKHRVSKLLEENKGLTMEARSARAYQDELDIVREKAGRADKLERQLQSFKDKMHELDFYKARVDELREDNKILVETKVMLEDQLASSQRRVDNIISLESELMNKRKEMEEINIVRENDLMRIQELEEYIHRLELDKASTLNSSANLEEELALVKRQASSDLSQSLRDQLSNTATSELLRLELENQRLQKLLAEQREQAVMENSSHLLELEKENKRLASKVEKLQENKSKFSQEFILLEQENQNYHHQVTELKNTLDTVKENSQRQILELERDNEQLTLTIDALRHRNEENLDLRVKEVEKENKRMAETVKEVNHQLSQLDYQYRDLVKDFTRLKEQEDKAKQTEELNERLEKENSELSKQAATLKLTLEKYEAIEQQLSDKEVEIKRLQKQADTFKAKADRVDELSMDNINLTVENQRLSKALSASKDSQSRVLDLEAELEEKDKELVNLRNSLIQFEGDRTKLHDFEIKCYNSESEIQKLNKSIELCNKKLETKVTDYEALLKENHNLEVVVQNLRLELKRFERMEEDNKTLEETNQALNQDRDTKEKEIKKLKQTLELKEATLDEYTDRLTVLEKDHRSLKRSGEKWKMASIRVKEHEKEMTEVLQKTKTDKQTITKLREELVEEKIRTQQITNELDQLKSELHKMGLDQEKLQTNVSIADEDRIKALQNMMEEAHKESLAIKEKRITALEQHIEEMKTLNSTLHRQLETMQREYQSYMDRKREEASNVSTTINVTQTPGKPSSSISQLVIKKPQQGPQVPSEQFLAVQKELIHSQKQVSTLMSENSGLKSQNAFSAERLKKLETQTAGLKGENNSLQSRNAQLQVENTTLQSTSNSLSKQNNSLQQQLAKLQSDFEEIAISHQELNETYEQLVTDHEQLQHLNVQLSSEYDALISEHGLLKTQHKQLKDDVDSVRRSKDMVAKEKAAIEEMRQSMHKERLSIQFDDSLQEDMKRISEEKQMFQQQTEKVRGEYKDLLAEFRNVKGEHNQLKLKHTELKGAMADCRDQLNRLDIQNAKLVDKCETLERQNSKLEEENKQLIFQLQALLQQNQELLTQTLESSEHFREEENSYREQLAHMRRAKEKLEEKIMDQYKNFDRTKDKRKGLGAVIVEKAKGLIHKNKSESRLNATKGLKDLTQSQLDLTYGLGHQYKELDAQSLSGMSVESRSSNKSRESSDHSAANPIDVTITKSNKVSTLHTPETLKLRKSRMKAQSIENLFDSSYQHATLPAQDSLVSTRPDLDYDRGSGASSLYNTTVHHQLTTDHRKIAVSSTALNIPVSVGPLREISFTIPIEEIRKQGAKSTDDLAGDPPKAQKPDNKEHSSHASSQNDHLLTKEYADDLPTKDVGMKNTSANTSASLFYTPPSRKPAGNALQASSISSHASLQRSRQTAESFTEEARLENKNRSMRSDYVSSPKPDLVMGTEVSPRGLVYYDQPSPHVPSGSTGPATSTPKYSTGPAESLMKNSRSHPQMLYAPNGSNRRKQRRRSEGPDIRREEPNGRQLNTQRTTLKPLNSASDLQNGTSQVRRSNTNPQLTETTTPTREENSTWYEYGCV